MLKERSVKRKSVDDKALVELVLLQIANILVDNKVKLSQATRLLRLFNLKVGLSANKKTN